MSSRSDILAAVRRSRPSALPLPPAARFDRPGDNIAVLFKEAVVRSGGTVVTAQPYEVAGFLAARFPTAPLIASTAPDLFEGTVDLRAVDAPHDLADLDVLVCRGTLGVAENGAVWLPESQMGLRAAPFLSQHLVLALDAADLVWNLHEAYARLDVAAEGYGVFVAGPSKTADIEQSLVIGAQGARSLTVVLL